jgi:hypothetical protein
MHTAAPAPQLLENGDILVPVERAEDGWGISRVSPEESGYAQWLRLVQERNRTPGLFERGVSFWLAGVLVFLAIPVVVMILVMAAHVV